MEVSGNLFIPCNNCNIYIYIYFEVRINLEIYIMSLFLFLLYGIIETNGIVILKTVRELLIFNQILQSIVLEQRKIGVKFM